MLAASYPTRAPGAGRVRLVTIPRPEPAPSEVLVRVVVSGVNPTDWKAREIPPTDGPDYIIPNQDGAGVVVAVGDGISPRRIGERVWVWQAQWRRAQGTAAEYVAVPDAQAVCLPAHCSFDLGAGLGIPAMTAHRCLTGRSPVRAGDQVLVHGGAGAVGRAAIELARRAGAWVATTVSSSYKAELAAEAGAELIIDYRNEDTARTLRSWAPEGVSKIVEVDLVRNLAVDAEVIAPGGDIQVYARSESPIALPWELMAHNASVEFVLVYTISDAAKAAAVAEITAALAEGALSALPTSRFPLSRTGSAHDSVRHGATGKVLVDVVDNALREQLGLSAAHR